jgi:ribosome recycling factor
MRRGQEQVQKITDRYIANVDDILQTKEHEVMEV